MSVPQRVLTNADLEQIVDTSDEWITTRTGIKQRRIAGDDETLSQFALEAARRALESAGVEPQDVDLIILATVTPDMPIPATACTVQHQLGCTNAAAFDLQAGCSGFIYAQSVAKQFLLSGRARHALVIGAELLSKYLNWEDRGTCVIFADGAGAVLMSRGQMPRGLLASALHTDGSMVDFINMPGGGTLHPPGQKMVGLIERDESFWMFCGLEYLPGIFDPDHLVQRSVKDQQGFSNAGYFACQRLAGDIVEKLLFDGKHPSRQVDFGKSFAFDFVQVGVEVVFHMLGIKRCGDGANCLRLRDTVCRRQHRRPAQTVTNQYRRRLSMRPQPVRRRNQIADIGAEIGIGEFPVAMA